MASRDIVGGWDEAAPDVKGRIREGRGGWLKRRWLGVSETWDYVGICSRVGTEC